MSCTNKSCTNKCTCSNCCSANKCCVIAFSPRIFFFSVPDNKFWNTQSGEVTLFDVNIPLSGTKQIMVDCSISAEIMPSDENVFNTYRLYVGNRAASQAGQEGETAASAPSLQTSSVIFGGNFGGTSLPNVQVKLTVIIKGPVSAVIYASNVNNQLGNFHGSKGCFMRVVVY